MGLPDIEAIVFDCFGVLYVDSSHYFYELNVDDYEALRPELISLRKQCDYGLITQAELYDAIAALTGLPHKHVAGHLHGTQRRNDMLMEYAGLLRRKYRVGLLSNIGAGGLDRFFASQEREALFDAVVLSGEEGIAKPHPAIYETVADRLGVRTDQCVMIDDSEENCAGADAAGMKAIRYDNYTQVRSELDSLLSA